MSRKCRPVFLAPVHELRCYFPLVSPPAFPRWACAQYGPIGCGRDLVPDAGRWAPERGNEKDNARKMDQQQAESYTRPHSPSFCASHHFSFNCRTNARVSAGVHASSRAASSREPRAP